MSSHSHTETVDSYQIEASRWTAGRNVLVFVVLVGVLASAAGYLTDPARFFQSYLVAFCYTTFVGLGAFFFVMVQFLTGSAWSVTMRRLMENIMATLPYNVILFVPIAFGLRYLYPWMDQAKVAAEEALKAKAVYLEPNAFLIRTAIYFVLWAIWVFAINHQSTKQDTERSIRQMHIASKWSAPGLFLAVAVGTLAAYDWLMSTEPSWFSTIFGLITLTGGALSFFSIMVLVCLNFRRNGILAHTITKEHYHDLGKWLFCLTAFYTYVAFSQYLLQWYSNQPEETQWYRHRMVGTWLLVSLAMPFLRFIIPFFSLLCRPAKRNLNVIAFFAVWSLVVEYIDLYWVVMPTYYPNGPQLHWLDLATFATTTGFCGLVFWMRLKRYKIVPVGDLRFEQSLHFENA